jgi:hypothetical protein
VTEEIEGEEVGRIAVEDIEDVNAEQHYPHHDNCDSPKNEPLERLVRTEAEPQTHNGAAQ